jgi:hypothetical protein
MKTIVLLGSIFAPLSFGVPNTGPDIFLAERTNHTLQNNMGKESRIKASYLVLLVKYAQGAVIYDGFYEAMLLFRPPDRKVFLSQIAKLSGHFEMDNSVASLAIKQSGLEENRAACLLLREGISEPALLRIVELPESELWSALKLLLTVFSIGYQPGYQKHKNAPDMFWYWDFSEGNSIYSPLDIDHNRYLQLDEILWP